MNILIIDDHALVKDGVEARIKKVKPEAKCYFAQNARFALPKLKEIPIELIFCDLEFSGDNDLDGFHIAKSIKEFEQRIKIIALTNYNSYRIMKKAEHSGFHSFLDKGCSFEVFSETMINVLAQGNYESPTMKRLKKKRHDFASSIFSDSLHGIDHLSKRELELVLICTETTNSIELSKLMSIAPSTIDTHFKNILSKLNLKHRKEIQLFSLEFKDEILKYKK